MRTLLAALIVACLVITAAFPAAAQLTRVYRIGVLLQGGPYYAAIDGLRNGLEALGFAEGRQYTFDIRDARGDLRLIEQAARELARDRVDLIYSLAGSVSAAAKRALGDIPIPVVFIAGSDPVVLGLVESVARPGGNFTGVHFLLTDLTPKRLEILKEILPNIKRIITYYDPNNRGAVEAIRLGRIASRRLKIEIVERHVSSIEELRTGLLALRPREVDAYFFTSDAMVASQALFIIERARVLKLPTIFHESNLADQGALATYGLSFFAVGRLAARQVHRVLLGAHPRDIPVERISTVEFVINLRTARELGITIPRTLLLRADRVIR